MNSSRRDFLKGLAGLGVVAVGATPPAFLARAAYAARVSGRTDHNGRILVVLQMAGGNDGLNTVVPYGDDAYYRARPGIAIGRGSVLRLDDYHGLHPALSGLKELYDEGQLAIVQGVGYPNPNRSHFRSMDIWHSARPEVEDTRDGWLGRALDARAAEWEGQLPALALGLDRLPLALVSTRVAVPTIRDPGRYRLHLGGGPAKNRQYRERLLPQLIERPAQPGSDLDFLRRTAHTALESAQRLRDVAEGYNSAVPYPATSLGRKLKTVAQMIVGELGPHIFFVSLDGFDTHSQQTPAHNALLNELSGAVHAFWRDMTKHHLAERVLLVTFSEFGRRVQENGSLGTDHGTASQMFVATASGKPGLKGDHPSLTDLDQGDLKFHTDFRSVYATILERWLEVPSEPVLGKRFPQLDFV